MEKEEKAPNDQEKEQAEEIELILFQVSECYVYLIPPRKSAASYRADEWNVNKWAWEGTLKVISKGEECIIRLEDKATGELYARAFLRDGEPHPVEPVIDSSRYFVLRIEENIDGRLRHAFIGIGFRERTEAYDFQAALHDHVKYLNKKKTAEEMEQHFQKNSSVDYSLKKGETLVLQIKNKGGRGVKSNIFEQGLDNLSLEEKGDRKEPILGIKPPPPPPGPLSPATSGLNSPSNLPPIEQGLDNLSLEEKGDRKEPILGIKPPPPPPGPLSPATSGLNSPSNLPPKISLDGTSKADSPKTTKEDAKQQNSPVNEGPQDIPDDDFGDFQAAG